MLSCMCNLITNIHLKESNWCECTPNDHSIHRTDGASERTHTFTS